MSRVHVHYNKREGRVELRTYGASLPSVVMNSEEFAEFLQKVFAFVDENNPVIKQSHFQRMRGAFGSAMRKDVWKWLGGAVKDKVKGYFKRHENAA